ncbi:hypothetical protein ADICYQ_3782 [Cyclobacterium qasimii M12-11B]|uniref:Uncharacterized protein n=1 Tax=Cyclobacterium qasimii M12-11B TaxID=641524 RepID=S7VCG4_9BACT|nr:hypothetical protein ADICYQ_3782 [Cyclobacterium qasimii M12-11B]
MVHQALLPFNRQFHSKFTRNDKLKKMKNILKIQASTILFFSQ